MLYLKCAVPTPSSVGKTYAAKSCRGGSSLTQLSLVNEDPRVPDAAKTLLRRDVVIVAGSPDPLLRCWHSLDAGSFWPRRANTRDLANYRPALSSNLPKRLDRLLLNRRTIR